jgi:hypothetical protein
MIPGFSLGSYIKLGSSGTTVRKFDSDASCCALIS